MKRVLIVVALVVVVAAIVGLAPYRPWLGFFPGHSELRDLTRVEELKAAFNEDAGSARLVMLLSPT